MAQRKATAQAPIRQVEGVWRKHKGTWTLVTTDGAPGDRFVAVSKAGVKTTGILVNLVNTDRDGLMFWTVQADRKSADEMAQDRALKASAQAAYWASDKGKVRAQRIAEWRDAQAQEAQDETPAPAPVAPVAHVMDANMDAIIAQAVAQAVAQALAAQAQAQAPVAPVVKAQGRVKVAPVNTTDIDSCEACGKHPATVAHKGAGLNVCKSCAPADADTLKMRAARLAK